MGCSNSKSKKHNKKGKNGIQILKTNKTTKSKTIECKLVLLGDASVGKSSIASRFCKNKFEDKYEVTVGGAYLSKDIRLKNGKKV